jgi:hypothetical protein
MLSSCIFIFKSLPLLPSEFGEQGQPDPAFHETDTQVCSVFAPQLPYSLCDRSLHYNFIEMLADFPTIYEVGTSASPVFKVNSVSYGGSQSTG